VLGKGGLGSTARAGQPDSLDGPVSSSARAVASQIRYAIFKEGDGMTGVEIKAALDGVPEFVAYAVEHLAFSGARRRDRL
jgi:hypothetical protein